MDDPFDVPPNGPLLSSGLAQIEQIVSALPAGRTVAVVALADQHGASATIVAAKDTAAGQWAIAGQVEKVKAQPGVRWRVAGMWSK